MERIEFKEIIELFMIRTIHEIKSESDVPNINFKFDENGINLFKSVIEEPFVLKGYWTQDATNEDLDFILSRNDDDCLTIPVRDAASFFKYLMDITNSMIDLYESYDDSISARLIAINMMKRIWLRMGVEDFNNVEAFLSKQLQFLNNRILDTYDIKKITSFYDYNVYSKTIINSTFDESTRSMCYYISDNKEDYDLPHILYDIDDDNTCYIYGVQNKARGNSKTIGRKLYQLNRGIDYPNVHPGKVYALMLFIKDLESIGITKIVIPGIQVLSYRYHELLSLRSINDLIKVIHQLEENPNDDYIQYKYNNAKEWFDLVYNKEDLISYLKTEELYNLIERITIHNPNVGILNEVGIQGDSIKLRIRK